MNNYHSIFGLLFFIAVSLSLSISHAEDTAPEQKSLSESLKRLSNEEKGYYAAIDVAVYKEQAVPFLIKNLESPNKFIRQWSTRALTDMVGDNKDFSGRPITASAGPALLSALRNEKDDKVTWYLIQAIGSVQPQADQALPLLIGFLANPSLDLRREAVASLGEYEGKAKPAIDFLIQSLSIEKDSWTVDWMIGALFKIDPSEGLAKRLVETPIIAADDSRGDLFVQLLKYPKAAEMYLDKYADGLSGFGDYQIICLFPILNAKDPTSLSIRDKLAIRSDLPSSLIALLGDSRQLTNLKKRFEKADPYHKVFISACMRALGEPSDRIVTMSATNPGNFKPKSADIDESRMDPDMISHGDGFAMVLITGSIKCSNGSIPKWVKFLKSNDGKQFGHDIQDAKMVVYYPSSGRFVYLTSVGAAYSMSKSKKTIGPYQTGADKVLIGAENALPLTITFYDEMPDVAITLTQGHAEEPQIPANNPVVTPPVNQSIPQPSPPSK